MVNRYEEQAFSLADEDAKEHVARLLAVIRRLDVKQREAIERVEDEWRELGATLRTRMEAGDAAGRIHPLSRRV